MRLFLYFARSYPLATALMLGCLLLAAVAEGVGISALLPLLGLLTSGASANDAEANPLERVVKTVLDHIGLEPGLTNLLLIMVGATVIQSGLSLLAKRQVGYTVARVTTDLRLSILRGLSAARWSYFTKQPTGEIANSMASETVRAAQGFLAGATIVSLSVQAALYSILALAVSWPVTIATVAVAGFVMYSASYFVGMSRRAGEKQTILMRSLLGRLTDTLQALKPLKAMSRE